MKKFMKRFAALVLAVMLLGSVAVLAADSSVTYSGNSGKFIFAPGSEYSPTDLFEAFKGVMPGDSLTEQIEVRNNADNKTLVRIYMRALGANPGSEAFLSELALRVEQTGKASPLFEAPADETAQLTDWVALGAFGPGSTTQLNVTLDVPIELGNDFQNAIGELVWEFRVEEFPVTVGPSTGDTTPLGLYEALLGGGTLVLLALLLTRKRRKSAEE